MAKKVKTSPERKRPVAKKVTKRVAESATARLTASVEKDLLAAAERYAAEQRTTVAQLVTDGLRKVIGFAKAPVLPPGDVEVPAAAETGAWGQLLLWMEEQQAALTEIRDALGDVAASLPNDPPAGGSRPATGTRIPPP
jgi:hypothetical protein